MIRYSYSDKILVCQNTKKREKIYSYSDKILVCWAVSCSALARERARKRQIEQNDELPAISGRDWCAGSFSA